MINDKIYITLWFWLFLLLILSSLHMVFRFYSQLIRTFGYKYSARLCTILSPKVRVAYLKSLAPNLSTRTCQHLMNILSFGDWLILVMMSQHLDIKLFADILQEIKNVSFAHSRSISTTIDIIHASDTDGEDDSKEKFQATPIRSPTLLRKASNILKKVVSVEYVLYILMKECN